MITFITSLCKILHSILRYIQRKIHLKSLRMEYFLLIIFNCLCREYVTSVLQIYHHQQEVIYMNKTDQLYAMIVFVYFNITILLQNLYYQRLKKEINEYFYYNPIKEKNITDQMNHIPLFILNAIGNIHFFVVIISNMQYILLHLQILQICHLLYQLLRRLKGYKNYI